MEFKQFIYKNLDFIMEFGYFIQDAKNKIHFSLETLVKLLKDLFNFTFQCKN